MPEKKNRFGSGSGIRRQYAALPIRTSAAGAPEILLVTSRGTRRWVIPKGWPMRKRSPSEAAAREAYEEAGLEGRIETEQPIGSYRYEKRLGNGEVAEVEVSIFLLRVARQLDTWPEQGQRQTAWFCPSEAADKVAEPELAAILRRVQCLQEIAS
jgi:8-oxo-dGTP pyrophosphatase MutT (NUDIX family)